MPSKPRTWLSAYQTLVTEWGLEPDWVLMEYQNLFAQGPVLDLGMGNGRNTLFFAQLGYEVDCIDISKTWVKKCQERTETEELQVSVKQSDLRDFVIPKRRYSLIIASKVLQFFTKSEIETLADQIYNGLAKHGCVYLRVFSLDEFEFYIRNKREIKLVEPNTYYVSRYNLHYHFFTKVEVLDLFSKLKVIHCIEGMESILNFKKPRKEWIVEYIGQRMR
ncbi:MAG: class I SAM-dependent methyltransferase [Promethearchaeota archaeon]